MLACSFLFSMYLGPMGPGLEEQMYLFALRFRANPPVCHEMFLNLKLMGISQLRIPSSVCSITKSECLHYRG